MQDAEVEAHPLYMIPMAAACGSDRGLRAWQPASAKTVDQRATDIWKRALDEYEQPVMDAAIREELGAFMAKRREEIGDVEP